MDKNTLVIGILLSLFVALIIYSIFKSKITNNLLKNILIGVIVLLGVISPTFIALTVNSLITPDKVMNKKYEQAFLDNARKELAKEYPNKLYSPNKKIKGNDEFSKQGAIDSLTKLLNDVRQKQSATEVKERFNNLNKDNSQLTSIVNKTVIDKYYLPDTLNNDNMVVNTSLALLSITSMIPNNEVTPSIVNLEDVVFDKYSKTAYIPLDIYTGRFSGLSFELVYKDSQWKLNPYSLMRTIQLSDYIISNQNTGESK